MFFHFQCVPLILIGIVCLVFAQKIADFVLIFMPGHKFNKQPYKSLLYIWPIRFIGIICLGFSFLIFSAGPSTIYMNKDENRIALLENGQIIKGEVTKRFYQRLASEGWTVIYKFTVENPETHQEKTYWGSAQGPKEYYINLSTGDTLTIIYNLLNPKINCEIKYFLNNPSYRQTFKKAGKLNLLDKFRDTFGIEEYSFEEWYRQQQEK